MSSSSRPALYRTHCGKVLNFDQPKNYRKRAGEMKRLHDDHDSKMCLLDTYRRAVENAGGVAAVAAHVGVSEQYVSQVINDKSPLGVRLILQSPDEVQKFLAEAWVEAKGGTVIWPLADKESAYKSIVRGLLALGGWQPKMLKRLLPMVEDEQERKAG